MEKYYMRFVIHLIAALQHTVHSILVSIFCWTAFIQQWRGIDSYSFSNSFSVTTWCHAWITNSMSVNLVVGFLRRLF